MSDGFIDPVTGVITEATPEALRAADAATRDEISRLFRALRPITEALAESHGTVKVPRRRDQTDTQRRAVRCPHCAGHYEEIA